MKKTESTLTSMVTVLAGTAVLVGALLAWVNHVTAAPIAQKADKTLADGIRAVMGRADVQVAGTDTVQPEGKGMPIIVHRAADRAGHELGAAVESATQGFGGDLRVLVGFDAKGTITGYTILQTAETPGLGAKADTWFQRGGKGCVIGLSPAQGDLTVTKDGGQVDAITASTITSRAFLRAINQAYAAYAKRPNTDGETGASHQMHNTGSE